MEIDRDSPQVRIPPPLVFLVCILLGVGIQRFFPAPIFSPSVRWSLAALFLGTGISLMAYCVTAFIKRKTNLVPWKPTTALVISGVYRYSRNPIYIAFILIGWGIAFAVNNFWMLISMFVFAGVVQKTAIVKEEKYLEQKFGEGYLAYKHRVRRWI
jgi:protein-S-isoprenylcysteine O-methyltransferase Ste14